LERMHGEGAAQYPNVLPPLHSFNTAERPEDEGIHVAPHLTSNLADVWSVPLRPHDIPLLWIPAPHTGSDAVRSVLTGCYGAVEAGDLAGSTHGMLLKVYRHEETGVRYVNLDVTDPKGVARAVKIGAPKLSAMVDIAIATDLHETSKMFGHVSSYSPDDEDIGRGRAFAVFRHPVHRAEDVYRDLIRSSHDSGSSFGMTLLEYSQSDLLEENPMVRSLSGEFFSRHKRAGAGPITAQHVEVVKEVVRRKILVGLAEEMGRTLDRFEAYFGWRSGAGGTSLPLSGSEEGRACAKQAEDRYASTDLVDAWPPRIGGGGGGDDTGEMEGGVGSARVGADSEEYVELARRNWADVQLYAYARVLFSEQAALLSSGGVPSP